MATITYHPIAEPFIKGLREDKRMPRNAPRLSTCLNAKPTEFGLSRLETITYPITDRTLGAPDNLLVWPYPQVFRGKTHTLLCARNAVYEVAETGWTTTVLALYNLGDPQTETLTNGTFTGNANNWTLGANWAYASNAVTHTAGSTATLSQLSASQAVALQNAHLYRVKYTVSAMTAGSVTAKVGTTGTGTAVTQDGTYTEDLVCSGSLDFIFTPTNTFDGTIDNVSVKEIKVATIPNGIGPWHFADFEDTWFMTNGTCIVCRTMLYNRWTTYVVETEAGAWPFVPTTMCNFDNRLLIAGLPAATTYFSDADWTELWATWIKHSPHDIMTNQTMAMGPNIVMYSALGGKEYMWPFSVELAMLGLPGQTEVDLLKSHYLEMIRKGDIGFIPMPWQGAVKCLKRMGDTVIAYGDNGITAIVPQQKDGMAIYRTVDVVDVGVAGRGAVGGDHRQHCFVDNTGTVWYVKADLSAERLGYSEFTAAMTDANIVVTFDPDQWDYYICDGTYGYIRSKTGFGRIKLFPTHLSYVSSGLISAYSPAAGADQNFEVVTDSIDLNRRGLKTVKSTEAAVTDVTNLKNCVEYKHSAGTTYTRSIEITCSQEGFAFPVVSGTDFRVRYTGTWGTLGKFDYFNIGESLDDKRNAAGALAKSG